jgi:protein N-terminal methyltransferase
VLAPLFDKTDLVEPLPHLMKKAKECLAAVGDKIGDCYEAGLESFDFSHSYDLIWFQWVVGHLTDFDFVSLLRRCGKSLNPGVGEREQGCIVVKENIPSMSEGFYYDTEDCTVMRGNEYFHRLFDMADLDLVIDEQFVEFPSDCMPVMKYVLRPRHAA